MDKRHDETEAIRELLNASNAAARAAHREGSQASQERPAAASRRPALPIPQTRRARVLRALQRLVTAPELWFVVALALTAGTAHAADISYATIQTLTAGDWTYELTDAPCPDRAEGKFMDVHWRGTFAGMGCYTRAGGGINVHMDGKPGSTFVATMPARREPEQAPAPVRISAIDLYAAYQANEVDADARFKGKLLSVTGIIDAVRKDTRGMQYISLRAGYDGLRTVDAHFGKVAPADIATLRPGMSAEITCRGDGMLVLSPRLDCNY